MLVLNLPAEARLWNERKEKPSGFRGKVTSIREFVSRHSSHVKGGSQ